MFQNKTVRGAAALIFLIAFIGCNEFAVIDEENSSSKRLNTYSDAYVTCSTSVGTVVPHRLNTKEYANSVYSLLGVYPDTSGFLAENKTTFGNIADDLTLQPNQILSYLKASEEAIEEAFSSNDSLVMICREENSSCLRKIIESFAYRAYRRTVSEEEISSLIRVANDVESNNGTFEESIKVAISAILISPKFLYRTIQHPDPNNPKAEIDLTHFEVASRLSYFIWSSSPDLELLKLAETNQLRNPEVLKRQIKRMLKDPKAIALVYNFATEWLHLDNILSHAVDETVFTKLEDSLKEAMKQETLSLLKHIFDNDLSLFELLNADYTFINDELASHYRLSGAYSSTFERLDNLPNRQGVLTHASTLVMNSDSHQTSIIKRGHWVMETFLCDAPPPPPENLDTSGTGGSEIEKSKGRLGNPSCAGCHSIMDPIGTGLQSFDALGNWRLEDENDDPIDSVGRFPSGESFSSAIELNQILTNHEKVGACFSKKIFTYALGRNLLNTDSCYIEQIKKQSGSPDVPVSQLIESIILSAPFMKQQGKESL